MKNPIITIVSTVALLVCLNSCKEDYTELIQKIETTQVELQKEDSTLVTQRNEIVQLVYTDTTRSSQALSPEEMTLTNLAGEQNTLITRLEVIMQKNKELIAQLNDGTGELKEVEKEFTAHLDELEMMKPEINAVKESYNKLVEEVAKKFKDLSDSIQAK
jgi:chromosome segregation ATPase